MFKVIDRLLTFSHVLYWVRLIHRRIWYIKLQSLLYICYYTLHMLKNRTNW